MCGDDDEEAMDSIEEGSKKTSNKKKNKVAPVVENENDNDSYKTNKKEIPRTSKTKQPVIVNANLKSKQNADINISKTIIEICETPPPTRTSKIKNRNEVQL